MKPDTRFAALTGLPRSGSTLCCHLVNAAAQAVALVEPMNVDALDPSDRRRAVAQALDYFRAMYDSLLSHGTAETQHSGGKVTDNPYGGLRADGTRERRMEHGRIRFDKPLQDGFLLMIKHNSAYAALLPELDAAVSVFGLVRNPLAVLASWHSVPIPPSRGRVAAGERLDRRLEMRLDSEPDLIGRQLIAMDWFFERYRAHLPEARILRYEEIVASQGASLLWTLGLEAAPRPLRERNASRDYAAVDVDTLYRRLLASEGAYWSFYSREDVAATHERMLRER